MTFRMFKAGFARPALGLALSAAMMLSAASAAMAGEGNPNYLGIFSSNAPTGYIPSPSFYSLAQGQNTLTFNLQVTNLTSVQQSMTLELGLEHIVSYNGVNIANGQPGVVNGAVIDGQFNDALGVEVQDPNPTFFPISIGANATQTLTFTRAFAAGACGYFEVDLAKQGLTNLKGLAGFEIRVLGCGSPTPSPSPSPSASPSPRPSPSPSASPNPSPSPRPSPTPFGSVLANTADNTPLQTGALILLVLGLFAIVGGTVAWRRRRL